MVNLPSFSGEDSKVSEARSLSNQLMECHSTHLGAHLEIPSEVGGVSPEVSREEGGVTGTPGQGPTIRTEDGNSEIKYMCRDLM
jgi:hypothetical protein